MAASYDLFVLLDPETPEERRAALVEQVKSQIGSGGATLKGDADWGMRRLAYEIDHRREAQYHLFQFEGAPEALNQLDRALSIDDSVLRHRIIRLPGEAPETTPQPGEEPPRRMGDDRPGRDGGRDRRGEREAAPDSEATEPPAAPAADEPVAEEPAPEEAVADEVVAEAPAAEAAEESAGVEPAPGEPEPSADERA